MARGYLAVKYVVLIVTVLCACVAIERFAGIKHWSAPDALVSQDLSYNASAPLEFRNVDQILDEHYLKCILHPTKPFCLLSTDKRLELFRSDQPEGSPNVEIIESRLENITTDLQETVRHTHNLIADFLDVMDSSSVKAIIIEPSILFCLLPPSKKYSLLSRGFNPGRLQGSRNVVTFGIYDSDAKKLNERNVTDALLSAGFSIMKIRKWAKSWNPTQQDPGRSLTSHYLFVRGEMAAHAVVFYRRNSYLWHAGLDPQELDFQGLLFVDDGIFENPILEAIPGPPTDNTTERQLFIPNDVPYFLEETEKSKYVECQTESSAISVHSHPFLTPEQLTVRAALSLRELKTVLAAKMAIFWLWSRSLLGWSEHCNILHYTQTLELCLTLKGEDGWNFTAAAFAESVFLTALNHTISDDFEYLLDGRGLHINITILREEGDRLWHSRSDGQNVYRVQYRAFPVCSTDIFGQKVNIPCNADDVTPLESKQISPGQEVILQELENNRSNRNFTESEDILQKLENNRNFTESEDIFPEVENNRNFTVSEEILQKMENNRNFTESEEIFPELKNNQSNHIFTESGEMAPKLKNSMNFTESEEILTKLENYQNSTESEEIFPKFENNQSNQNFTESGDMLPKLKTSRNFTESEESVLKLENNRNLTESEEILLLLENIRNFTETEEIFPKLENNKFNRNFTELEEILPKLENIRNFTKSEIFLPKFENIQSNRNFTESEEILPKLENNRNFTESEESLAKLENYRNSTESEDILLKLVN